MKHEKAILLVLRIGLAFAFLYPAISAYFNPLAWVGYFPSFMRDIVGNDILLQSAFGVVEVIIALWLLSGKHIFYPSIAAAAMLLAIVLFNFSQMDVLFRDISILAMAIALALSDVPKKRISA